jgi:hypothetical protein
MRIEQGSPGGAWLKSWMPQWPALHSCRWGRQRRTISSGLRGGGLLCCSVTTRLNAMSQCTLPCQLTDSSSVDISTATPQIGSLLFRSVDITLSDSVRIEGKRRGRRPFHSVLPIPGNTGLALDKWKASFPHPRNLDFIRHLTSHSAAAQSTFEHVVFVPTHGELIVHPT